MERRSGIERRRGTESRHGYKGMERRGGIERRNNALANSLPGQIFRGLHQKLLELREERKTIVERSGDAIFVAHPVNGEILEANNRAVAITGYPLAELQGMNLESLFPAQEILSKTVEFNALNGNSGLKMILRREDGASVCVDMSACSIHRGQLSLELVFIRRSEPDHVSRLKSSQQSLEEEFSASINEDSAEPVYEYPNIIGKSETIRKTCQLIGHVARTPSTVLLLGESGTGKEIVAQAIHFQSLRSKGPFVKVNCAALSETLLESELFGHVKGAFTGAIRDRKGRFVQADGGTIFLDEIACMPLLGQAKLLRVLEEREFEPVGGSATASVDVRIIAATNTNLKQAVAEGRFREDLYYRLNVFSLFMSPLREKKEDIPLLAQHFLKKYNLTVGKEIRELAPETLALMTQYNWPGNVRELKNAIEHAVIIAKGPVILPSHLPSNLTMPGETFDNNASSAEWKPAASDIVKSDMDLPEDLGLRERLNMCEKRFIQEALKRAKGVKKDAANILQIDPKNFAYLLRKHDLFIMALCYVVEKFSLLYKT